jgi:hypothetical protein
MLDPLTPPIFSARVGGMDSLPPPPEKQSTEYTTVPGNKFIDGVHPHPWRNVTGCSDALGPVTDHLERNVYLRRTLSDRIGPITDWAIITERHVIQWLKNWGKGSDIAFAVLLAIITTGLGGLAALMEGILKGLVLACFTASFAIFLWMFIRVPDWGSYKYIRNAFVLFFASMFLVGGFCIVKFLPQRPLELQNPSLQPPAYAPARSVRSKGVLFRHEQEADNAGGAPSADAGDVR